MPNPSPSALSSGPLIGTWIWIVLRIVAIPAWTMQLVSGEMVFGWPRWVAWASLITISIALVQDGYKLGRNA